MSLKIDPTFNTGTNANPSAASNSKTAVTAAISAFNSSANTEFESLRFNMSSSLSDMSKNIFVTTEKPTQITGTPFPGVTAYFAGHYTVTGGYAVASGGGSVVGSQPEINYTNAATNSSAENGAGFIYLDPSIMNNSSHVGTVANVDGGNFDMSLLRTIVHEIGHAATIRYGHEEDWRSTVPYFDAGSPPFFITANVNYNEEIAVFVENIYYVPYAQRLGLLDSQYRIGHTPYDALTDQGGRIGVDYFIGMSSPTIQSISSGIQFNALKFSDDYSTFETVNKTYHHTNHQVLGNSYDRYITVVATFSEGIFSKDLNNKITLIDRYNNQIIPETINRSIDGSIESVRLSLNTNIKTVESTYDDADSDEMTSTLLKYMGYEGLSDMVELDQTRSFSLGADRFFDSGYRMAGVTSHGQTSGPSVVAIDDRWLYDENPDYGSNNAGTLIVGAGGYHEGYVDLSTSTDMIQAGEGDDLIIAGTAGTSATPNYLFGNGGNDIVVSASGADVLNGGNGNDMIVGSTGNNDIIYGGDGFDVASYASNDFAYGIYYHGDLSTITANGLGKTDSVAQIEAVVGSSKNDTFKSGGNHVLMIGGEGDDTFYLENRDVAIGGAGDDDYHINIKTGSHPANQKILIMGFEQGDQIFIDDVIFHGSTSNTVGINGNPTQGYLDAMVSYVSGGSADPYASSHLFSDPDASSDYWTNTLSYGDSNDVKGQDLFSLITINHVVNGQVSSSTEIYLTAFKPGEGGIEYSKSLTSYGSEIQSPGYNQYQDVGPVNYAYMNHMPGYPTIGDYFQNIEPFLM